MDLTLQDRRVVVLSRNCNVPLRKAAAFRELQFLREKLVNEPFMKIWPLKTVYFSSGVFGPCCSELQKRALLIQNLLLGHTERSRCVHGTMFIKKKGAGEQK